MSTLLIRPRGGGAQVAELTVGTGGFQVVRCADPALMALLQALGAEPHLSAAVRTPLAGGGHAVAIERLAPGDPGYPRALAAAIARKGPWSCEAG